MITDKYHFNLLEYVVECDECGREINVDADSFQQCVDSIKGEGWKIKRDTDGEIAHYCPVCKEEK